MKIIAVDNYDRETRSDTLVATGLNEYHAVWIVELLNADTQRDNEAHYRAVPDEYKLYAFDPT